MAGGCIFIRVVSSLCILVVAVVVIVVSWVVSMMIVEGVTASDGARYDSSSCSIGVIQWHVHGDAFRRIDVCALTVLAIGDIVVVGAFETNDNCSVYRRDGQIRHCHAPRSTQNAPPVW